MSAEAEARRLSIIGLAVALCIAALALCVAFNPWADRSANRLSIVIDLPYVGEGVTAGAPMMMHGVTVGNVAGVSTVVNGRVRLDVDLEAGPTAGLTDTMGVDFRPANYFGVTGINLIAGQGGNPLRNGVHITATPQGNFTLQALLYRAGEITNGLVSPQLVDVINRATSYTDGLNPLIESVITAARAVAAVQTVSTEQLLRNTAGISVAFPGFVEAATVAGYGFNQRSGFVKFNVSAANAMPGQDVVPVVAEPGMPVTEEFWNKRALPSIDLLAKGFFGAVGKLLSSHTGELLPVVNVIRTLTDTVPGLVTPAGLSDTLVELRTRFEKLYGGSPEQRALQVHIVLDQIPGVQAPISAMGGP